DGEAGGEAGTLDAEQVDEAGDAVRVRSLNDEIGIGLAGSGKLRADAAVGRLQAAVGKARPVGADGAVKAVGAGRVDMIVDPVDPFDIGSEAGNAVQVQRQMDAEPTGLRDRVDE